MPDYGFGEGTLETGGSNIAGGAISFDSPASLPGFTVNQGVPGATVGPAGSEIDNDYISSELDPAQVTAMEQANADLPDQLYSGVNDIAAQEFRGDVNTAGPPMAQQPGYLQADVIGADQELVDMLQSAARRTGRQAALMAPTVRLLGLRTVVAGGSTIVGSHSPVAARVLVGGSEYGGLKQFEPAGNWFFSTVDQWRASNPTQQTKVVQPLFGSSGGYALFPGIEKWRSTRAQEKIETGGYPMDVGKDVWEEGFGASEAEWDRAAETSDVWAEGGFGDQTSEANDVWENGLKPVKTKVNTVLEQWASVNYGR